MGPTQDADDKPRHQSTLTSGRAKIHDTITAPESTMPMKHAMMLKICQASFFRSVANRSVKTGMNAADSAPLERKKYSKSGMLKAAVRRSSRRSRRIGWL